MKSYPSKFWILLLLWLTPMIMAGAPSNDQVLASPDSTNPPAIVAGAPPLVIFYQIPRSAHVTIIIYNILGQEVITLVDDLQTSGKHRVEWNGTDELGTPLAGGIYFYRIVAMDAEGSPLVTGDPPQIIFQQTQKLILLPPLPS